MSRIISFLLNLLFSLPVILISLSVHELSHGFVSDKLGDPTARNMGRLTLNPIKHIDPIGLIALVLFHIGWAKPVMVNSRYFKKPKRDMALTALAGPVSNFLLAAVFSAVLYFLVRFTPDNQIKAIIYIYYGQIEGITGYTILNILTIFVLYFIIINVGLGVFNLFPIPPLDGSKILYAFLPYRIVYKIQPYEKYVQLALILLLWLGVLSKPIQLISNWIINLMTSPAMGVFA